MKRSQLHTATQHYTLLHTAGFVLSTAEPFFFLFLIHISLRFVWPEMQKKKKTTSQSQRLYMQFSGH